MPEQYNIPSERIDELAEKGKAFEGIATSTWDYIRAIKQYLDEERAKHE